MMCSGSGIPPLSPQEAERALLLLLAATPVAGLAFLCGRCVQALAGNPTPLLTTAYFGFPLVNPIAERSIITIQRKVEDTLNSFCYNNTTTAHSFRDTLIAYKPLLTLLMNLGFQAYIYILLTSIY